MLKMLAAMPKSRRESLGDCVGESSLSCIMMKSACAAEENQEVH